MPHHVISVAVAIVFTLILVTSPLAKAADAPTSAAQLTDELAHKRARQSEIEKRRKSIAEEQAKLNAIAEATDKDVAARKADSEKHDGGFIGRLAGAQGDRKFNENLRESQDRQAAIKAQISKLSAENRALGAELGTLGSAIARGESELNKPVRQIEIINLRMENYASQSEIQALRAENADTDAILNRIEASLEQTKIGYYVRDKVAQLVNSELICKAQKRCAVQDPKKLDGSLVDEVFPEIKGAHRTDYYKKVDDNRERLGRPRRSVD
ncbi:MAG: hypothetical protein NDI61_11515 [Bdellovibrionaceae bacterium]|nr:hypothetical protein [Pseudobdellovibrionaceae bacterium]